MYPEYSVKQDPESHTLAQKTMFDGDRSWMVLKLDGSHNPATDEAVAHWVDLKPVE